jgi:hypothetical protein
LPEKGLQRRQDALFVIHEQYAGALRDRDRRLGEGGQTGDGGFPGPTISLVRARAACAALNMPDALRAASAIVCG